MPSVTSTNGPTRTATPIAASAPAHWVCLLSIEAHTVSASSWADSIYVRTNVRSQDGHAFTIAALRDASVNVETIRFYQRKGLLPQPFKPPVAYADTGTKMWLAFYSSLVGVHCSRLMRSHKLLRLDDGTHCRRLKIAEQKPRRDP